MDMCVSIDWATKYDVLIDPYAMYTHLFDSFSIQRPFAYEWIYGFTKLF